MDDDLPNLSKDELIAEVKRLRAGVREHRDASGHGLCWHHPQLWGLLPKAISPHIAVPRGRNSCAAASSIANRWIASFRMRRERMGSSIRHRTRMVVVSLPSPLADPRPPGMTKPGMTGG